VLLRWYSGYYVHCATVLQQCYSARVLWAFHLWCYDAIPVVRCSTGAWMLLQCNGATPLTGPYVLLGFGGATVLRRFYGASTVIRCYIATPVLDRLTNYSGSSPVRRCLSVTFLISNVQSGATMLLWCYNATPVQRFESDQLCYGATTARVCDSGATVLLRCFFAASCYFSDLRSPQMLIRC